MSTRDTIEELLTALHGLDTSTPEAFASSFAAAIETLPRTAGVDTEDTILSGRLLEIESKIEELEDPSADIKENAPDEFNDVEKHHLIGLDHFRTKLSDDAPTQGDLVRVNMTPLYEHLHSGDANNVLTMVTGLPAWAVPADANDHELLNADEHPDTVDEDPAVGDLIHGEPDAGKWSRLPIGDSDDVLFVSGGLPVWAPADAHGDHGAGIPSGIIVMWSGSIATIPDGWVLCNGDYNTPDLRDKFILGAASDSGDTPLVDETGGFKWHGETENNHGDHALAHTHLSDSLTDSELVVGDVPVWTGNVETQGAVWTGSTGEPPKEKPSESGEISHNGPYNTYADTDNRPPYYALAFIMKT